MAEYVNGNNGAASHYKFNKEPIDNTVKVYKMTEEDKARLGSARSTGRNEALASSSFSKLAANVEASMGKDERKYQLEIAISKGEVKTVKDAMDLLVVSNATVAKYLRELGIKLPKE